MSDFGEAAQNIVEQLYEIAIDYHANCEMFDRRICISRNERGIAMPTTRWEMTRVEENARDELSKATMRMREIYPPINEAQARMVIQKAARYYGPRIAEKIEELEGEYDGNLSMPQL